MIKRNKATLIITTAIMLLPMVIGLIVWNKLPEQVPIHWNAAGEVDGWGGKSTIVFWLPLFVIGIQWLCVLATCADPKSKELNGKALGLVLWICPFIELLVSTFTFATALGLALSVQIWIPLAMGLMFMVLGNFMPKFKRNYTIGFKVPWALNDDENWNKTHRFGGKVMVIGGAVIMATSIFGNFIVFFGITMIMVILPVAYSYLYYRRHKDDQ